MNIHKLMKQAQKMQADAKKMASDEMGKLTAGMGLPGMRF